MCTAVNYLQASPLVQEAAEVHDDFVVYLEFQIDIAIYYQVQVAHAEPCFL